MAYGEKYSFNFFTDAAERLESGGREMVDELTDAIVKADDAHVDRMLMHGGKVRYSIQGYKESARVDADIRNRLIDAGYVLAVLDVMRLYVQKINERDAISRVNTKYRDIILNILAQRGTMLHKDLAAAVRVSPSALNAVIKKMNSSSIELVHVEKISKYTLYSITPQAYKYITESAVNAGEQKIKQNKAERQKTGCLDIKIADVNELKREANMNAGIPLARKSTYSSSSDIIYGEFSFGGGVKKFGRRFTHSIRVDSHDVKLA